MPRPPTRLRLVALGADAGTPLGRFVAARGGVPEKMARSAISRGGAFVAGRRVRDPERYLREGDRVEVDLREPAPAPLPVVLHLDRLVLGVDKPAGVLAQEGRSGGTALPDLCSRLLRDRGEPARTRFHVLRRLRGAALVAAFPETGRTHQVRVHLAALGLPLAGDARYGGPRSLTLADGKRLEVSRPLLHALALRVRHPGGHDLELRAEPPADFEEALAFLAP